MRKNTWLLLDVSCLAYRAHYSRQVEMGEAGEIVYALLQDVLTLQEVHGTSNIVFCFDGGCDCRTEIYPEYKQNRRKHQLDMPEEELEKRRSLLKQLYLMRTEYLLEVGYKNILHQPGYEADDIIAWLTKNVDGDFVVVSADQDLYQLLGESVTVWNPIKRKPFTAGSFIKKYEIDPSKWWKVKAIAGCSSDNIPGIYGVGEKNAVKYLNKELSEDSTRFEAIRKGKEEIKRNGILTKLPFKGCGPFELQEECVGRNQWNGLMRRLGFEINPQSKGRTRRKRNEE